MRRKRTRANRKQPSITALIRRIQLMPDDELRSLCADYAFLAAIDQNAEVRQIRDACLREIEWRATLPSLIEATDTSNDLSGFRSSTAGRDSERQG